MPYVMVPVPEEHVQDVMQFVLREMAKASLVPWDDESVSALFHEVDEASRSLLAYAARASMGGTDLSEAQAADMMQLRQREVAGIIRDLNERAAKANRPSLVGPAPSPRRCPTAGPSRSACCLDERRPGAPGADAERAELADVPPLGDRSG